MNDDKNDNNKPSTSHAVRPQARLHQTFCPVLPSDGRKWSSDDHLAYWSQWFSIPKTKEDWTQFMINRIRKKVKIDALTDEDLEGIIRRAKAVFCITPEEKEINIKRKHANMDPDLPDFYYWTDKQVGEWIEGSGFPEVKEMFLANKVSGRKLISMDACALNQMGLRDLDKIRGVTRAVRSLLQVPAPNALRAIMRLVPFELYLNERAKSDTATNYESFKMYCQQKGFDYGYLVSSGQKNHVLKQFCTVEIKLPGENGEFSDDDTTESTVSSNDSYRTVEHVTRSGELRDLLVNEVFEKILRLVMEKVLAKANEKEKAGRYEEIFPIFQKVKDIFAKTFEEFGLTLDDEKSEFIASVANHLVDDILRTREILEDFDKFSSYMNSEDELDPNLLENARHAGAVLLGEITSIATLLSMGQLDLEVIIRDAPQIRSFVQDLVAEAEDLASWRNNWKNNDDSVVEILSNAKLQVAKDAKQNWGDLHGEN